MLQGAISWPGYMNLSGARGLPDVNPGIDAGLETLKSYLNSQAN